MTRKFNRTYKGYQPGGTAGGPSTERICKPTKCSDDDSVTPPPPPPPNPDPTYEEELAELIEWYRLCRLNCETVYCQTKCKEEYDRRLEELKDKHNRP